MGSHRTPGPTNGVSLINEGCRKNLIQRSVERRGTAPERRAGPEPGFSVWRIPRNDDPGLAGAEGTQQLHDLVEGKHSHRAQCHKCTTLQTGTLVPIENPRPSDTIEQRRRSRPTAKERWYAANSMV